VPNGVPSVEVTLEVPPRFSLGGTPVFGVLVLPVMATRVCGALNRNGQMCKQAAGYGTDHPGAGRCKLHSGCTPAADIFHSKRTVRERIKHIMSLGVIPEGVSPEEVMLQEVARAAAAVAHLDSIVAQFDDDELRHDASAKDVVTMWNEQRVLLRNVGKAVIQAGIAKHAVQVQEMTAQALITILMAVMQSPEVNMSTDQQRMARMLMANELRALSSPAAIEA